MYRSAAYVFALLIFLHFSSHARIRCLSCVHGVFPFQSLWRCWFQDVAVIRLLAVWLKLWSLLKRTPQARAQFLGFASDVRFKGWPVGQVNTNLARAEKPIGYEKKCSVAGPHHFVGHVTMWEQWQHGKGVATVKLCDHNEAAQHGGNCHGECAVLYSHVCASNACEWHTCMHHLISDIWHGHSGDAGHGNCTIGANTQRKEPCKHSVRHIRVQGPSFEGSCMALGQPGGNTCKVGDGIRCPGSSAPCKGHQCRPDGSVCLSASHAFHGCA